MTKWTPTWAILRSARALRFVGAALGFVTGSGTSLRSESDVAPCAPAHYSFGTAVASNGSVLFTEFNHRKIQSWDPHTRRLSAWRTKETPGMFGLATGSDGDVFVGLDLGDQGNPGKILRLTGAGTDERIVDHLTRPRQLTCDSAGNLYAVLEGGRILRWDRNARTTSEIMSATAPVSGIAVGADGSVYVSEYGTFETAREGYARPSKPGQLRIRRPNGEITIIPTPFWRVRGIALHGNTLYLCSESDREDHGNAGCLARIDTLSRRQDVVLDRLDYPQFPAVDRQGAVYFTLARDNRLVVFEPRKPFETVRRLPKDVLNARVRGGSLAWGKSPNGIAFNLRAETIVLSGTLRPKRGSPCVDGWIEIQAERFRLNPNDLYPVHDGEHPTPGIFELPRIESSCESGDLQIGVLPRRRQQGCRWPMQHPGTAQESPAPGFSEQPETFRIYFRWVPKPA